MRALPRAAVTRVLGSAELSRVILCCAFLRDPDGNQIEAVCHAAGVTVHERAAFALMDAHPCGKQAVDVMRLTHGARFAGYSKIDPSKNRSIAMWSPLSPFAAKFAAVSPYAGNGLLRNFEPFNP